MTLYIELAVSYWRFHKKKALTILLAVLFGTAACFCALLLVRSLKVGELEKHLDEAGNYDMAFYVSSKEAENEIREDKNFDSIGTVYQLGIAVCGRDGEESDGEITREGFPVGSLEDVKSEKMWHLTPVRGRYPVQSGEITMDAQTMKSLGYPAETNQTIPLTLWDNNGSKVLSKDFVVVGVVEQVCISDDFVSGYGDGKAWNRGYEPMTMSEEDEDIAAPYAYISEKDAALFSDLSKKILLANVKQVGDFDDQDIVEDYLYNKGYISTGSTFLWLRDDIRFNVTNDSRHRSMTANIILSWEENGNSHEDLNTSGLLEVQERMEEGREYADSTTRVVIPVIAVIIMVLTSISVYEAVKAAMTERARMMGLLRCLGLTKKQAFLLLVTEVCGISLFGIGMGYLFGFGIYEGLRLILEKYFATTIYSAFSIDVYFLPFICKVTFDPVSLPLVMIGGSVIATALFTAIRMTGFSPLQAYVRQKSVKRGRRAHMTRRHRSGYFNPVRLFAGHVRGGSRFGRILLYFNVFLLMSSAVFGYVYFRQVADVTSAGIAQELEQTCLSDYDYIAAKTFSSVAGDDLFHNMGIAPDDYEYLASLKGVKEIFGTITDRNTKLSIKNTDENQELMEYMTSANYRSREERAAAYPDTGDYQNDVIQAYGKMEKRSLRRMGYDDSDAIYNVPTVAIRKESLQELSDCVVKGSLDWDKLNTGEETAVVLLEDAGYFHVGDSLSLSQVIYPEELDQSKEYLGGVVPKEYRDNNTAYHIRHGQFEIDYYVCGSKKDIMTKVGAVLVLDEKMAKKYYCTYLPGGECPVNFLTGVDGLKAWDVPDKNYTQVQVSLKGDAKDEEFESEWYRILGKTAYMSAASRTEKETEMLRNRQMSVGIFCVLILLLALIGMLGMVNVFAIQLQNMRQDMAMARLTGADRKFLKKVVFTRFMPIPVVCGILSVIPVMLVQKVYDYGMQLRQQALKGVEDITYFDFSPWYFQLPADVNLFRYHLLAVVLAVTVVMGIIFWISLMPQVKKMEKANLIEEVKVGE